MLQNTRGQKEQKRRDKLPKRQVTSPQAQAPAGAIPKATPHKVTSGYFFWLFHQPVALLRLLLPLDSLITPK